MLEIAPQPVPAFPPAEFEDRIERARAAMRSARIDALLISGEPNFRYFTGDVSPSPYQPTRPKFFVLPLAGEPCAIVHEGGHIGLELTTWLKTFRTWPAPRPQDEGVSVVAETLRECATRFGRIGAELGPETRLGFPVADFLRLRDQLSPLQLVDAELPVLRHLRMLKSEAEIAKVRMICQIVSEGYDALTAQLEIGDTEWSACHKLQMEVLRRGASQAPKITGISGHYGYERSNVGPTDRVLGADDLLSIDSGCLYQFYWSDFCRHWAFGGVSDATRRAHEALYRATGIGIAAARPGRTMSEVWHAMAAALEAEGFDTSSNVGRMGHGMGLSMPEPPSIGPGDHTVIEPGMILNIEPSAAYVAEDGRRKVMLHEEDIAVQAEGVEMLTLRAPAEIPVVGR